MIEFSFKNHKFCFVWFFLIVAQAILLALWHIESVPAEYIFVNFPIVSICIFFINMCESENLGILKIRQIQYGLFWCEKVKFKTFIRFEIILVLLCTIQLWLYGEVTDIRDIVAIMIIYFIYVVEGYIIAETLAIIVSRYIASLIGIALFIAVQNENNLIKMLYWNQLKIWINVKDKVEMAKNYFDSYLLFCLCTVVVISVYIIIIICVKGKGVKIEE